jgi:hypothetical protein
MLYLEVAACRRLGVASHVPAGPDIDACAASRAVHAIQLPGRSGNQHATLASDIEYPLATAPRVERKHEVFMTKLSELHIREGETLRIRISPVQKNIGRSRTYRGPIPDVARTENSEQQARNAKQKQIAQNVWRVDPKSGLSRAERRVKLQAPFRSPTAGCRNRNSGPEKRGKTPAPARRSRCRFAN